MYDVVFFLLRKINIAVSNIDVTEHREKQQYYLHPMATNHAVKLQNHERL